MSLIQSHWFHICATVILGSIICWQLTPSFAILGMGLMRNRCESWNSHLLQRLAVFRTTMGRNIIYNLLYRDLPSKVAYLTAFLYFHLIRNQGCASLFGHLLDSSGTVFNAIVLCIFIDIFVCFLGFENTGVMG